MIVASNIFIEYLPLAIFIPLIIYSSAHTQLTIALIKANRP